MSEQPDLPPGFGIVLDSDATVCDGGRTLMGGGRVLRLSATGARSVSRLPATVGPAGPSAGLARSLLERGLAHPWWPEPPSGDATVRDVTVVVPTRDRAPAVAGLLQSLPAGVPVVVVDDGSRDPGALAAVCHRHGAVMVPHARNRGPAAARNTGLRAVTTPYVAFCDSDILPLDGWLGSLRRHLDDPAVAMVAPRVLGRDDGGGWVARYERDRSSLDLGPLPQQVRIHGKVAYLPSACLLARVDALADGFDEELRSGEDVDLVWRLVESGWSVRYEPAATVSHDHRTGVGHWLSRKAFYGTSAAPLARRHPGAVAPMVIAPWSAVLIGALLAQRRWSLPVAGAAYAVATADVARRLPSVDRRLPAATVLTLEGGVAAGWQAAAAITRHYWPVAAVAALVSRRARRAVLVAAVIEGLADRRRVGSDLDPARYLIAHRLDDLAYGAGLWWGALRERSTQALRPVLAGRSRT